MPRGRGPKVAGGGAGSEGGEEYPVGVNIDADAVRRNVREVDLVRIVMFMVSGALCGTLGLTGMEGFVFYMTVSMLVGFGIAARMGFQVKEYTGNGSILTLIVGGALSQIMGFIMFWTLFYSLKYVY